MVDLFAPRFRISTSPGPFPGEAGLSIVQIGIRFAEWRRCATPDRAASPMGEPLLRPESRVREQDFRETRPGGFGREATLLSVFIDCGAPLPWPFAAARPLGGSFTLIQAFRRFVRGAFGDRDRIVRYGYRRQ
jgi:hypothetical protein